MNSRFSGKKHAEESKEKISIGNLGKKLSEETKEKMGRSKLGNTHSLGKKRFEETKEKIRKARLGALCSTETKEKMRKAHLGKKFSEKSKEKMGKAKLGNTYKVGNKLSEETKEKISTSQLGKKLSTETKEKMRVAHSTPEAVKRQRAVIVKLLEEGKIGGWPIGESYPEKIFREFLEFLGAINGVDFVQEHHIGTYSLDFAYVDEKRYIEIDGGQHLELEAIEHDRKRDGWLESQGWIGIRLPVKGLKEYLYRKMI